MRRSEVARAAQVDEPAVEAVTVEQVRDALTGLIAADVLEVATQEPATYWRIGDSYWLDDPYFGDVVALADLAYDIDLGLHRRRGDE